MMNSVRTKKSIIIILSLCFALCLSLALIMQTFAVKAEATTSDKLSSFVMDEGASIRCVSAEDKTSGIRFTSSISASEFNTITNNDSLSYEYGMLMAKGDFQSTEQAISILKANENTTGVKHSAKNFKLDENKFEYNIAIYNVQDTTKTYVALGYFTVGEKTYYADVVNEGDNLRSLFQVAVGFKTDVVNGLEAEDCEIEYTENLIDAVMVSKTVSLDQANYTVEVGGEIKMTASVDGKEVKPVYEFGTDGIVEEVDGKFIAKKVGTTTVKAVVKGSEDYESVESTITVSPIEITDVAGFLALKNAKAEDEYALANDITIKVNGTGTLEEGSDTYWNGSDTHIYCLIQSFAGKLDGNGHKITIINTTAFTGETIGGKLNNNFAGVFNNVKSNAVIENVAFDILIKNGGGFKADSFSSLIYKLEGTLKNCYIKTTIDGNKIGEQSAVVRTVTTDASLENNIYELDGKLATVSRDMKHIVYKEKQIVIGAGRTEGGMFTCTDNRFNAKLDNAVYYNSIVELLGANNYGKSHISQYKVTTSEGGHSALVTEDSTQERKDYYHAEKLTDRVSKLEYGEPWTFDYENREIKLCGKTVIDDKIHIKDVAGFLAINNSTENDEYVLDNDITITVNGRGSLETGSDVCWIKGTSGVYSIINSFAGKLNGNGHRITIQNTIAFDGTDSFTGVFNIVAAGAVIENVVFDIQIKRNEENNNFTPRNFSSFIYKLDSGATLKNCFVKTTINGEAIGVESSFIRSIINGAILENNVFETDGKIYAISMDTKINNYDGAQIVIGPLGENVFAHAFCASKAARNMKNLAIYKNINDMLNGDMYGKTYNTSTNVYEDRTSKLAFEDAKWTFDYENGELKLCGQTVVSVPKA